MYERIFAIGQYANVNSLINFIKTWETLISSFDFPIIPHEVHKFVCFITIYFHYTNMIMFYCVPCGCRRNNFRPIRFDVTVAHLMTFNLRI